MQAEQHPWNPAPTQRRAGGYQGFATSQLTHINSLNPQNPARQLQCVWVINEGVGCYGSCWEAAPYLQSVSLGLIALLSG